MASSIQEWLPRTWPVFFAQHGNLTSTQQAGIPPILGGQNTLLIAPTATGKTEAVIAPLLERHLLGIRERPPQISALYILYICPTRALVRDLYARLLTPLTALGIPLMSKSGDTGPVPLHQPPTVLLTTPESLDSLLTRAPRLFGTVRAIVLDEIHLFDCTPRGDQLRCLLRRIEHIRTYQSDELGQKVALPLQRVALSATVPNPAALAHRYLVSPAPSAPVEGFPPSSRAENLQVAIVQLPGLREMVGIVQPMANLHDLITLLRLQMGGQSQSRKTLIFCNARHEVEQVAAYLRQHLPFETTVFVHYSNLDPTLRREVEAGLAQASSAICVCTSTLELGIDIGTIDMVILVGPPPSPQAFVQRIGRAGRRRRKAHVIGMARSWLEEIHFQALFYLTGTSFAIEEPAENPVTNPAINPVAAPQKEHGFFLSVLVQQIFSILKQSPTGGIRLADLRRVSPDSIDDQTLWSLLNHLVTTRHLVLGRPGEWRVGPALAELVDAHEIYSNIGNTPQPIVVVDAYTGRPIAHTERIRLPGETLFIGGRLMEVVWRAQYRLGVRVQGTVRTGDNPVAAEVRTHSAPFAVSLEVSQTIATLFGFSTGQMALLQTEQGNWLFHFWGDLYGELLAQILRAHLKAVVKAGNKAEDEDELDLVIRRNEHCIQLADATAQLPAWNAQTVRQQLYRLLPRLEPLLELGRFHTLLPPDLAMQTVVAQVDLAYFEQLYHAATIITPTTGQRQHLERLLQ